MRSISLILLLILLFSCAKTTDEKVAQAIDMANTYLSKSKCDSAIEVLEDVGRQNNNAIYLQVLASAYACRAGFSELTFLLDDIEVMTQASTPTAQFLNYLSIISTSAEVVTDSDSYKDLREAINILIDSTSASPSQAARNLKFGRKAGDMGMQALLMLFAQLGKFSHLYGNVDPSTGAKGGGGAPNNCFITYTAFGANLLLPLTGSCIAAAPLVGHADLDLTGVNADAAKSKLCEGLIVLTNIIDIFNYIELPADSTLSALSSVKTTLNNLTSIANTQVQLKTLLETTDQTACETLIASNTQLDYLQLIYASIFEGGLL